MKKRFLQKEGIWKADDMNSTDLMFFAAVAETGGIGRAAARLNTVQSNVTGRIRALERAMHVPLFYRGSRGVTLTRAGERLLPYAIQVGRLLSEAHQAVLAEGEPRGPLRIGAMETTAALRLPGPLADFAGLHPEVDIELETGPTEWLIGRVLDRSLEGAFVAGPVVQAGLTAIPVLAEDLVLAAHPAVADLTALLDRLAGRGRRRCSCSGPAAPIAGAWRISWPGRASCTCAAWSSARSTASSAAWRPAWA